MALIIQSIGWIIVIKSSNICLKLLQQWTYGLEGEFAKVRDRWLMMQEWKEGRKEWEKGYERKIAVVLGGVTCYAHIHLFLLLLF